MINQKLRSTWNRVMRPIGAALARTPLTPDAVTYAGVAMHVVVAALIVEGRILAAGLVGIVAALTDALDGALARAKGTTGRWGAFLDSTTDRLTDALYLAPIVWLYGVSPDIPSRGSQTVALLAMTALIGGFLVSYSKARAESLGFRCDVGLGERAERLIVVLASLILDQVAVGMGVLAVLTTITFIQRAVQVRGQASERADTDAE